MFLFVIVAGYVSCGIDMNCKGGTDFSYFKENSTIYCYDYFSGKVHPLCCKKGCRHNDENCDFYEVIKIIEQGDIIYFLRDDGYEIIDGKTVLHQSICTYDKTDRTVDIIYTVAATQDDCINFHLEVYEDWLYFYRGVTVDSKHKNCTLYRLNLKDGCLQELLKSDLVHSYVYNDRLIYNDLYGCIYTTDLYGNNRINIVKNINGLHMVKSNYSSEYVYYNLYQPDSMTYDLYRTNIFDDNVEFIAQNVPESLYYGVAFSNDHIYYYSVNQDFHRTEIYSCMLDGSCKTFIKVIDFTPLHLYIHNGNLYAVHRDSSNIIRRTKLYETDHCCNTDGNLHTD